MVLSKSKIFLICCISFIVGIAAASFLPIRFIEHDFLWFIMITLFLVWIILFYKNKKILIIALIGLFLFLGVWRYSISIPVNLPNKIWYYNSQTVSAIGWVCNEPDIRDSNEKLEICVNKIIETQNFTSLQDISGKILVTTNLYPSYKYGDELKIIGELKKPEKFYGFSYDRYLARYDIYSVSYYPKIEKITDTEGNIIYQQIFKVKEKLHNVINYGLSEPEASLANAIILGYKKNIPEDLRQNFSQAGVSHIIAISGMHISILAGLIMAFLLAINISRKKAFWLASLFLIIYILLIGLPASAMRAGLMGFLVLWAMNLGRLNKLTNSLVLAAVVLLFINPKLLRDDIGFQLSFLAVLGISYFYPWLSKWWLEFNEKKKLPKIIKASGI
ncbi:MAG: ComEC family competence protein, partial [Patescibacteria group bacterium]